MTDSTNEPRQSSASLSRISRVEEGFLFDNLIEKRMGEIGSHFCQCPSHTTYLSALGVDQSDEEIPLFPHSWNGTSEINCRGHSLSRAVTLSHTLPTRNTQIHRSLDWWVSKVTGFSSFPLSYRCCRRRSTCTGFRCWIWHLRVPKR